MSAATDCACARSLAHRQNATSPPAGRRLATRSTASASAARRAAAPQLGAASADRVEPRPRAVRAVSNRAIVAAPGAAEAPQRLRRDRRRRSPPAPPTSSARLAGARSSSCASSISKCSKPRPRLGLLAHQPQRVADQIAVVARARLGQHPLVGAVDLGELDARAPPLTDRRSPPTATAAQRA